MNRIAAILLRAVSASSTISLARDEHYAGTEQEVYKECGYKDAPTGDHSRCLR